MPALLACVPDAWGPKFGTESGAVTRTWTGPNEIAFKAPAHMALVMFTPQPNREIALNSSRRTVTLAPVGTIEVVPAEADLFARWRVAKENLLVAHDQHRLAQLAGAEFQNEDFEFRPPRPGFVDQQALQLANLIRAEFQRGEAANDLCFDALITLFGTHLLRSYSSFSDRPRPLLSGGLSPRAWRAVTDYIHANLSESLSVGRLAELAGLSPSHFLRAFRQTSGQAPHQYVVAQRLALVEQLTKTTDIPFAAVAKAAGFSSNSHMTATMKRTRGVTPNNLRREQRRLDIAPE
ncbi:AraC family transcriptional regulator [Bradyrhizobium neotropicale]|uniref:AraC family transcriptional regulator n=1 Tax=Bradyrhizobium neotropicale TaxID=1497615 RepID=UPI001AD66E3D|nr:AraC family transcriptional regulator [Bradyrhizobium neotropicale]MBO4225845.1 helix-turn-helix domain-containing protein [Bradyrhizobium neotropicale]